MALAEEYVSDDGQADVAAPVRWRLVWRKLLVRIFLAILVMLVAAIAVAWFSRVDIAQNLIARQLEQAGLPATYDIEEIGPERQVLRNIVIGDPASPDATVERIVVSLRYNFGIPALGRITLVKPRLYGTFHDGKLSFGALDPLLFTDSGEPPALPNLDVAVVDGRGLIDSDFGPIGIKAEGQGDINDGFTGIVAATAPIFEGGGCQAKGASAYGAITTKNGKPQFSGPLRLAGLNCPRQDITLGRSALQFTGGSDAAFSAFSGSGRLATGKLSYAGNSASGLTGTVRGEWRNQALDARYTLAMRSPGSAQISAALLTAEGSMQARQGFRQIEAKTDVEGNGIRLSGEIDQTLASLSSTTADTLVAPLLDRARAALKRESPGSKLAGQINLRRTGDIFSLIVPTASLTGGGGQRLLSLSRLQVSNAGSGAPRFSGNILVGGAGLPGITGRMEGGSGGNLVFRMRMAEYAAQGSAIAIPELVLAQSNSGALGFSGQITATGPLPGGSATNLRLPLTGNWSSAGGLSLWPACTQVGFDRLVLANLSIDRRNLKLCPARGHPILRANGKGLRIAAGLPSLELSGKLADTPILIASGPIGFAYPGALAARDLDITLGPDDGANRFTISNLDAQIGADIAGTFSEADIRLFAVPLDLKSARGDWQYSQGVLTLDQAAFTLQDRQEQARFKPMLAREASLALESNVITANATLREPESDREVAIVDITHNLSTSTGHADLAVKRLVFDDALQPEQLSELARGVIANADGVITGTGRIDWSASRVTSSGAFATDGLDFAAAFGPVKDVSGQIIFTDLINLVTAPNQRLKIGAINPGIEVNNGEVEFALLDNQRLAVHSGSWPFLGGTLELKPVLLNFSQSEIRAYVMEITGADAAQFVAQMDMANLSATGTFDGRIPLVFDEMGNGRIENGVLVSRVPGGNVSYVGELTYKDLSPMANFAFRTLRSLDYRQMLVEMNGSLTGELVTKVRFDGVTQGVGTKQNFITRQLGKLPIRFDVNVRAPFYQLITSFKSMYDPAFVKDPREVGLILPGGTPLPPAVPVHTSAQSNELPVQSPESEKLP